MRVAPPPWAFLKSSDDTTPAVWRLVLLFLSAGLLHSVLVSVKNCPDHGAEISEIQITAEMRFKRLTCRGFIGCFYMNTT